MEESDCWVDELTKVNSNLTTELIALREHVDKVRAEAVMEFYVSQPCYNELGIQDGDDFKDFRKHATILFPRMDFS